MVDLVAVCIFYTHIRFMKGMCSDHSVKLDVHTRRQVLRPRDSHETTSLTRPNSNPGLPGSASSQLVLLCFSRDLIRSFTAIIRSLREVTLSREFNYHPSFPAFLTISVQRVYWLSGLLLICSVLEMEGKQRNGFICENGSR